MNKQKLIYNRQQECTQRNNRYCTRYKGEYVECDGSCSFVRDYVKMLEIEENENNIKH